MKRSLCRTCFVVALVGIQLAIVPASQLLHFGCDHVTHTEPWESVERSNAGCLPAVQTDSFAWSGLVRQIWAAWYGTCCDCHPHSNVGSDERFRPTVELPGSPTPAPDSRKQHHDSNECCICRTVFAARLSIEVVGLTRLTTATTADRRSSREYVSLQPEYRLLSRGPPLVL